MHTITRAFNGNESSKSTNNNLLVQPKLEIQVFLVHKNKLPQKMNAVTSFTPPTQNLNYNNETYSTSSQYRYVLWSNVLQLSIEGQWLGEWWHGDRWSEEGEQWCWEVGCRVERWRGDMMMARVRGRLTRVRALLFINEEVHFSSTAAAFDWPAPVTPHTDKHWILQILPSMLETLTQTLTLCMLVSNITSSVAKV